MSLIFTEYRTDFHRVSERNNGGIFLFLTKFAKISLRTQKKSNFNLRLSTNDFRLFTFITQHSTLNTFTSPQPFSHLLPVLQIESYTYTHRLVLRFLHLFCRPR